MEKESQNQRERKLEHLNRILLSIRNVNQLIVSAKDRSELLTRTTEMLVEHSGYSNAWIVLMDENGEVLRCFESGTGQFIELFERNLKSGELPKCAQEALSKAEPVVVHNPLVDCPECPLASRYAGRAGISSRLCHEGRCYGVLCASIPTEFANSEDEIALFADVANDLGFALDKLRKEDLIASYESRLHLNERITTTLEHPIAFIDKSLRYLSVNNAYSRFYDKPIERIEGRRVAKFVDEKIFQEHVKPGLERCLSGEDVSYEVEVDFPDGKTRTMLMRYRPYRDRSGEIAGVVTHGTDVTERRRAQAADRRKEEKLRLLFDNIAAGIAELSLDFKIKSAYASYCEMLGYAQDEIQGLDLNDLTHPEYSEENMELHRKLGRGEIDHYRFEKAFIHKDGHTVYGILDANLVRNENGEPDYFIGTVTDITDLRYAEQELKRFEWLLEKENGREHKRFSTEYGDVTELNTNRRILDAVGKEELARLGANLVDLLDTSLAIYEANGDYAFGMFTSNWCRLLDLASRRLCDTDDNAQALSCGKWLCHENCWNQSATPAILSGEATDIECIGDIRLYAEPIIAGGEVIGVINIGYGNPPKDEESLRKLADRFDVDIEDVRKAAHSYKPRPEFIINMAKRLTSSAAKQIGDTVERKEALEEVEQSARERKALLEAARHVLDKDNFEEAARGIFNSCRRATRAVSGYVALLSEEGSENEVLFLESGGMPCDVDPELPMPVRGLRAVAYEEGRAVFDNDFMKSEWTDFLPEGHVAMRNVLFAPIIIDDKVVGVIGLANKPADFTEDDARIATTFGDLAAIALRRALAKEALSESEHKHRLLAENTADCIWQLTLDGVFMYVNPATMDLFGYEPQEIVGNSLSKFTLPAEHEKMKNVIAQTIASVPETTSESFTASFLHKNGTPIPVEIRGKVILDEKDKPLFLQGVTRDITERVEAERELAETEEQLRQSQKLDAIGRLAGGVAHDLNNMLSPIIGYSELLQQMDWDEPSSKYVDHIHSAGEKARDLVHQLLAFSRRQVLEFSAIDMNELVAGMRPLFIRTVRENILINFELAPDLPRVQGDGSQIEQVLMNLVVERAGRNA
ncbi:MAG: PAS domain S-box protein [Planctomycetota bacterium]|nr:PAS domain S-box protein [Planctomycetota bacterium]